MEEFKKRIATTKKLLFRLQMHVCKNQNKLYHKNGRGKEFLKDRRYRAFGYQRVIFFCAINDCVNFTNSLDNNLCFEVNNELGNMLNENQIIEELQNYPVYNFIIRFYSILEFSARSFLADKQFNKYLYTVNVEYRSAYEILQSWRNTIHKNGILDIKVPKIFDYRKRKIIIEPNKVFHFDFWDLYRIAKDGSDLIYEFAKKNFNEEPELKIDDQKERRTT